jgi:hypothetical protein
LPRGIYIMHIKRKMRSVSKKSYIEIKIHVKSHYQTDIILFSFF